MSQSEEIKAKEQELLITELTGKRNIAEFKLPLNLDNKAIELVSKNEDFSESDKKHLKELTGQDLSVKDVINQIETQYKAKKSHTKHALDKADDLAQRTRSHENKYNDYKLAGSSLFIMRMHYLYALSYTDELNTLTPDQQSAEADAIAKGKSPILSKKEQGLASEEITKRIKQAINGEEIEPIVRPEYGAFTPAKRKDNMNIQIDELETHLKNLSTASPSIKNIIGQYVNTALTSAPETIGSIRDEYKTKFENTDEQFSNYMHSDTFRNAYAENNDIEHFERDIKTKKEVLATQKRIIETRGEDKAQEVFDNGMAPESGKEQNEEFFNHAYMNKMKELITTKR